MHHAIRPAIGLFAALTLVAAACSSDDSADSVATPATPDDAAEQEASPPAGGGFAPGVLDSGATIASFDQGGVIVHTYTNPEAGFGNSTAVIESDNAVVLVDAHFAEASAAEFRSFAESFGKPIERLVLTHDHPDHIGGVEPVFSDIGTYSSSGVVDAAAEAGTTITNTLEAGETEIDGITYRFDVFTDAEAEEQVVITLPDFGVVAAGDLVYSDFHAVMTPTFDNWLEILSEIAETDGLSLIVPGHGTPGGPEVLDDIIDYLDTARTLYVESDDADTFNAAIIEAFPDRPGRGVLDFGSTRLFPKSTE